MISHLVLLATELFAITQRLLTEFHNFPVLLQLVHRHEIVVLDNLKRKQSRIITVVLLTNKFISLPPPPPTNSSPVEVFMRTFL